MGSITAIYVIAIVFSIIIAFLLIRLSKATVQPKQDLKLRSKRENLFSNVSTRESLKRAIFEEIKEVVLPGQRPEEVSEKLSGVFSEELKRQVDLNRGEFNKKYGLLADSSERSWKSYKRVLADQRETEAVIRSVAEGLVVLNAKGNVIMLNPAAEEMLGVSKKSILGKPILDSAKTKLLIALAKSPFNKEDKEIQIISRDDGVREVLRSSNSVIEDENGKTIGMIYVSRDVARQNKLDHMKSNFVSTVTHELRTPLIATQKAVSLLLDKDTSRVSEEMEKQFLSIADRNLKRLGMLIDDLLDLSKLEAGKMKLKHETVDIQKVIEESIEALETWAMTKSIKIEKRFQENMPRVSVDPGRIIQVLNNLIGNAIKFTPNNGTITVEAVLESDNKEVKVSVEDTGVGIEEENLSKVFDKFYQIGERAPTDINGTGIGLSIAKEIVELHGGEIWAENKKDQGTRFSFKLKAI